MLILPTCLLSKYVRENYIDPEAGEPLLGRPLNWDQDIEWEPNSYVDLAYVEVMDSFTYLRIVVQR